MTSLGRAALAGAVIALGAFLFKYGFPLEDALDPFVWIFLGGVAGCGAILGVAGELAWRNVRESRTWLLWTALCLLALSALIVRPFIQERREQIAFLATADSARGAVESKFVRGGPRLRVTYTIAGQTHRLVTPGGDPRYDQWDRGDSVWVYFQSIAPDSARVGRLSANAAPTIESLQWVWGVGGLLVLGFLPPVARSLKRARDGAAAPVATARPLSQALLQPTEHEPE